jgi:hypothetical protein
MKLCLLIGKTLRVGSMAVVPALVVELAGRALPRLLQQG